MGAYLDSKMFSDWVEYIVAILKDTQTSIIGNPLWTFGSLQFLGGYKMRILNEVRNELGLSDDAPTGQWESRYRRDESHFADTDPMAILYLDFYLENTELILNEVRKELGMPTEDPISVNKKVFLKGLEDLLEKTDPSFLYNLQDYLSTNGYLLKELKKYLGISDDDDTFDAELSILLKSGYQRLFDMVSSDQEATSSYIDSIFSKYLNEETPLFRDLFEVGKEWLYLYVKLSFDPPTASTLTYLKERLNELEWYIANYNLGDWIYGEQKHADIKTPWD